MFLQGDLYTYNDRSMACSDSPHTFFYVHQDMTAHTQPFNKLGALGVSARIQTHAIQVLAGCNNHSATKAPIVLHQLTLKQHFSGYKILALPPTKILGN